MAPLQAGGVAGQAKTRAGTAIRTQPKAFCPIRKYH